MAIKTKDRSKKKGWHTKCIGVEQRLDGALIPFRPYFSKDDADFEAKANAVKARWLELKAQGLKYWPEHEIAKLEHEGLIRPRKALGKRTAIKLLNDVHIEALTADELKPFVSDSGAVRPDAAPQCADFMARKVLGRLDVRSELFNQLHRDFVKDPLSTLERCSRIFGWSAKEAQSILIQNNVGGGSPIAFDASEGRSAADVLNAMVEEGDTGEHEG